MGSDCASILIPLRRSHGLCVSISKYKCYEVPAEGCSCKLYTPAKVQRSTLSTIYNPHCTHNPHCAMCDRRSTIPHCAMCDRQSTIHIVQRAIDNPPSTMCKHSRRHSTEGEQVMTAEQLYLYKHCNWIPTVHHF